MDAIRQWAFSACAAVVVCGIGQMLLPKSNMQKMFQLAAGMFFLCCLLTPFVLTPMQLDLSVEETTQQEINIRVQQLEELVESQSRQQVKANLEKIIQAKLSQMGINYHSITINIITNGQNSWELGTVEILLFAEDEPRHTEVLSALNKDLMLEFQLSYA